MKKLKIYSTLLIVSLVGYFLLTTCSSQSCDNQPGEELEVGPMPESCYTVDSIPGGVRRSYGPIYWLSVHVERKSNNDRVLLSHVPDFKNRGITRTNMIEMEKVKVQVDNLLESPTKKALFIAFGIIGAILYIWVFVLAYKILRSVRRGDVFVSRLSRYMHRIGWILLGVYFYMTIGSYCWYLYLKSTIHVAQYNIVYHNEASIFLMILGFFLLIVSQIILLGKDLKEEQELTI